MSAEIRERAKKYLDQVPPNQMITSNGPTASLYTKLTGLKHEGLWDNWRHGGEETGCNNFVGTYGNTLGSTTFLGQFPIQEVLKKIGKYYAWVPSVAGGAKPQCGDIVRWANRVHMGVSLDFEGDMWNSVEAGHGGPKPTKDPITKKVIKDDQGLVVLGPGSFDIIKRMQRPFDPSMFQGWVDIELYFGAVPVPRTGINAPSSPVPVWLVGWWRVVWEGRSYYYYFDNERNVGWTTDMPGSTSGPISNSRGSGGVSVNLMHVSIRWKESGSLEQFDLQTAATIQWMMRGTHGIDAITAVKMT
jgi:hypothetical protein